MSNKVIEIPLKISDSKIVVSTFESDILKLEKNKLAQNIVDRHPGVYCFFNNKSIYIGESVHPFQRLKEHVSTKKLQTEDQIIIFRSEQFHKSAIYDIETKLIEYVAAEQKYKLRNTKENQGNYDYFLKYAYAPVIKEIWKVLSDYRISTKKTYEIEETQLYKLSPYKDLNASQSDAVETIIKKPAKLNLIKGYPGTGKSIIASQLYRKLSQTQNVCLTSGTHHTVSAFKNVFKLHQKTISTSSKILKTSELLKSSETYETIIVDEAHRLSRRSGKGHPMKYAHIDTNSNELDMIMKKAKNVIILYDQNQIVHDGDFNLNKSLIAKATSFELKEQMRSMGGYDYINWFMSWLDSDFKKLPKSNNYDVKIFDDFSNMYDSLKEKSREYPLTRLVSGYTREWISKNDQSKFDFDIDGIKLKWNDLKTANSGKWMESEAAKNLEEVSYYHVVQGFDMHYAGVIIGKDLYLDENDQIQVNEDYVVHTNQKPKKSDPNYYSKLKKWVVNRYKILLSRGAKGAYIYIEDDRLREKINGK